MKIGKLMNLAEQTTNRKSKGKLTHLKTLLDAKHFHKETTLLC
jgi:hypothetical protein